MENWWRYGWMKFVTKRQRRMEMDRKRTKCIWRVETKDHNATSTGPTQKRRKIQGRSRHIRTRNWRSSFTRTKRQMETNRFPIKNNVTCRKELWDIWQGTTGNSQSTRQIVTIPTRHGWEIWSMGRPQKPKYFKELHKLNGWQARWYLKLQDYNFILWHIPGKTNMKEDILSRREKVDMKKDNQDIQMLEEELWV